MEKKLFNVAFVFVFFWVTGQVGMMSYSSNLISAIVAAIAMGIFEFYTYKGKQNK